MNSQANQGTKVTDWLDVDRAQILDQDLCSAIKRKSKNTPVTSSVNRQNQRDERNEKNPTEELVKYMSNLPSYLEKGDNLRERALSFGVLDWRRLEKWQDNHKQTFSPSNSNDSSYFSMNISSSRSSRGRSCSPNETVVKEVNEFQDLKEKYSLYGKYQSFIKMQEKKLKECERDDIEVQRIQKTKTRNGKSTGQVEELGDLVSGIDRIYPEKGKNKFLSDKFDGIKQASSILSESFESPSHSSNFLISSSRGNNLEDKPTKIGILENHKIRSASPNRMLSFGLKNSRGRSNSLDLSSVPVQSKTQPKKDVDCSGSEIPKLRNPSPTRRFSIDLNRFSPRSSFVDFSNVPQLGSQHDPYFSPSKKDEGFFSENMSSNKLNVGRKSQMSPLRRLFDPLLKSTNSEKLYAGRCVPSNRKHKPSNVQAVMQLSMKDGLPLFTFADDKNSGVLAATMKKVRALRKGENSWIYTFFNVDEVKKKSNWMNKGCKGETHGYFPSVIAQMRVSDIKHDPINNFITREFVSFSVDVSGNNQKTSNIRFKDELVAILVKIPKDVLLCNKIEKSSDISDQLFSITAILPGESHGVPSKGKPSPLIKRWKSGGLCDCGGWDLGCRLKVITSGAELDRRSNFYDTLQAAERVQLFPQGEVSDRQPVFLMSPFKDNVYSVEFSSLSFLQAFSICISLLNCRKSYDLPEIGKLFEGKTKNTLVVGDVIKTPNPPLSPVGRV